MEDNDNSNDIDFLLLEGENAPTNPSLWSRAKAAARRKFTKYPCVSMDSLALTKQGWKSYGELKVGEIICTYNISTGFLEWKPVISLHYFSNAPTVRICTPQTNFNFVCTPNHKWVLNKNWVEGKQLTEAYWERDCLIETKDIGSNMEIIASARLAPCLNENNLENENPLVEIQEWSLSAKNIHSTQNIVILENEPNQSVWCPETENHTWVMKQNGMITITGNSAYANAWASKWYKSKGGGWRKKKKKKKANESIEQLKQIIKEELMKSWNR